MPNINSCTTTTMRSRRSAMKAENSFITIYGQGDLAVMSIETYEMLKGKLELYHLLNEGRTAVKEGRKRPLEDVMRDIKQEITDGKI